VVILIDVLIDFALIDALIDSSIDSSIVNINANGNNGDVDFWVVIDVDLVVIDYGNSYEIYP
jgi:membrane protein involved in colicin uptake